jgi:hypothetical protein
MLIFKYPLEITDMQYVDLPAGAQILSVMNQHERLVLYALADESAKSLEPRRIIIRGTMRPAEICYGALFIGSVAFRDGALVHVFQ